MTNANGRMLPALTPTTAFFWTSTDGRLRMLRCADCGFITHPPGPVCRRCGSSNVAPSELSGRGRVYTYTVVYHATHVAMKDRVPYISALIQLEEGPRVLTNLVNCLEQDVSVDMPVRVVFERLTEDITLPQFEPDR